MGLKSSKKAKAAQNDAGVAMQPQNVQREEDKLRIAELEARITELEIEIKAQESKKDEVKENVNNNNNNNNNNNDADVAKLKSDLEEAQRKLQQAKAEYEETLSKMKTDLEKANADLAKAKEGSTIPVVDDKAKKIESDLKESKANEAKLRDEIITLKQKVQMGGNDDDSAVELEKTKKLLQDEKELNAGLRKELNERTKESLANLSKPTVQTSSPVVLSEATEYMKMNEVELRSKIALVDHDLELSQEKVNALETEVSRLKKANSELAEKMKGKDLTIGDLTVQVHAAQGEKVESHMSGLDSKLEDLEGKQNKFDADIEMMEENMRLQMLVDEKDEIIRKLKEGK